MLANLYLSVKRFCKTHDIVVVIDSDDLIIGRQGLKIINSVYNDPNIWYVYTRFILTRAD